MLGRDQKIPPPPKPQTCLNIRKKPMETWKRNESKCVNIFLFMQSLQINMNISKHNIQLLMLNNRAQNSRHYNKNHINFTNLQFFFIRNIDYSYYCRRTSKLRNIPGLSPFTSTQH